MTFDFRRLTPALATSLALMFSALVCTSIGWTVVGWFIGLAGLTLNVVGVAVTQVNDPHDSSGAVGENPCASEDVQSPSTEVVEESPR